MTDQQLVAQFLRAQVVDPESKVRLPDVYTAFKMMPKTEGIRKTRFIQLLLKSGADVRQDGRKLYLHGLALANPPDSRPRSPSRKTIRVDEPRLCLRCGEPCEGPYSGDGKSLCEDCRVTDWVRHGAHGARHRYAMMRT